MNSLGLQKGPHPLLGDGAFTHPSLLEDSAEASNEADILEDMLTPLEICPYIPSWAADLQTGVELNWDPAGPVRAEVGRCACRGSRRAWLTCKAEARNGLQCWIEGVRYKAI